MKINELAASFLHVKESRDEEKRVIDYDLKKELSELQKGDSTPKQKLSLLAKKDEIEAAKHFLEEREIELKEVSDELLGELKRAEFKVGEKLEIHVEDQIFFSVWYDENNAVHTAGTFHKIS
ncbi:MAG: hypothetical protein WC623_07215 [Pedobacter sp.]|uniref:hypothetical protein n=1 Tax=Pedobacter sp. TaxID=1411316 RepID=UPI00356608F7